MHAAGAVLALHACITCRFVCTLAHPVLISGSHPIPIPISISQPPARAAELGATRDRVCRPTTAGRGAWPGETDAGAWPRHRRGRDQGGGSRSTSGGRGARRGHARCPTAAEAVAAEAAPPPPRP